MHTQRLDLPDSQGRVVPAGAETGEFAGGGDRDQITVRAMLVRRLACSGLVQRDSDGSDLSLRG